LRNNEEQFPSIEKLDLSKNRFSVVPNAVYKMRSLKSLSLSCNFISRLTIQITELVALAELDLWDNQLTDVPLILFNLKRLKKVDLSNNKITRIQSPFIETGRIKFDLFGNPIRKASSKKRKNPDLVKSFIESLKRSQF
jgi:internalin A